MFTGPLVLENTTGTNQPRRTVQIDWEGRNTQAIGARVTMRGPGGRLTTKEVAPGGFASSSSPWLTFAMQSRLGLGYVECSDGSRELFVVRSTRSRPAAAFKVVQGQGYLL